jgi:hypothetical protein
MSWGAQNRSKDAKTPSASRGRLIKPELDCCPIQPYKNMALGEAELAVGAAAELRQFRRTTSHNYRSSAARKTPH